MRTITRPAGGATVIAVRTATGLITRGGPGVCWRGTRPGRSSPTTSNGEPSHRSGSGGSLPTPCAIRWTRCCVTSTRPLPSCSRSSAPRCDRRVGSALPRSCAGGGVGGTRRRVRRAGFRRDRRQPGGRVAHPSRRHRGVLGAAGAGGVLRSRSRDDRALADALTRVVQEPIHLWCLGRRRPAQPG